MPALITTLELESLPLEPSRRFVALEEIVRRRYESISEGEEQWNKVQDARLAYMGTIVGAAKSLKIEPIASLTIPKKSSWNDDAYEDFKSELDFYTIQLALQGAELTQKFSITLEGNTRSRLYTLVAHLKEHVRKLELSPGKLDRLLERINGFERELDQPRLSFAVVAGLTLFVAGAIADLGGAADQIRHLVHEVEAVIGVAKEEQDIAAVSRISAPPVEIKRLERPNDYPDNYADIPQEGPTKKFDLDDEIPF